MVTTTNGWDQVTSMDSSGAAEMVHHLIPTISPFDLTVDSTVYSVSLDANLSTVTFVDIDNNILSLTYSVTGYDTSNSSNTITGSSTISVDISNIQLNIDRSGTVPITTATLVDGTADASSSSDITGADSSDFSTALANYINTELFASGSVTLNPSFHFGKFTLLIKPTLINYILVTISGKDQMLALAMYDDRSIPMTLPEAETAFEGVTQLLPEEDCNTAGAISDTQVMRDIEAGLESTNTFSSGDFSISDGELSLTKSVKLSIKNNPLPSFIQIILTQLVFSIVTKGLSLLASVTAGPIILSLQGVLNLEPADKTLGVQKLNLKLEDLQVNVSLNSVFVAALCLGILVLCLAVGFLIGSFIGLIVGFIIAIILIIVVIVLLYLVAIPWIETKATSAINTIFSDLVTKLQSAGFLMFVSQYFQLNDIVYNQAVIAQGEWQNVSVEFTFENTDGNTQSMYASSETTLQLTLNNQSSSGIDIVANQTEITIELPDFVSDSVSNTSTTADGWSCAPSNGVIVCTASATSTWTDSIVITITQVLSNDDENIGQGLLTVSVTDTNNGDFGPLSSSLLLLPAQSSNEITWNVSVDSSLFEQPDPSSGTIDAQTNINPNKITELVSFVDKINDPAWTWVAGYKYTTANGLQAVLYSPENNSESDGFKIQPGTTDISTAAYDNNPNDANVKINFTNSSSSVESNTKAPKK